MKLIDKYIFFEWGKAFLLTLSAIILLILLGVMYDDLLKLIKFGGTPLEITRFFIILIPSLFPIIVPVALLVSLLFVLGTLHRNNEVIAMRAAGRSFFEITRSLWAAGAALTLLLFYLNAHLIPWSIEEAKQIESQIRFKKQVEVYDSDKVGLISRVAFDNTKAGRLWYMNRFSEYTLKAYGVTVYQRDSLGNEHFRVMGREAFFDEHLGYWVFLDGREILFNDAGDPIRSLPFEQKTFPAFTEDSNVMALLSKKPRHLSLFQIKAILDSFDYKENSSLSKYAVKYHAILATPLSCLIVVAIAIPFAISGVRTNPLVGVAKALLLFFIYYFVLNVSGILGSQQILSPWLAAWFPNILLIAVAGFLYRRFI